jgi:regulatory protein
MFHVKHAVPRHREWDADSLYAYGLRLLSYRARSEREIRDRFKQRSAEPELIDSTITRLRSAGFVDDEAFAQAWVDSRRRASPRGDRLLRQELAAKGVARPSVDSVLQEEVDALQLARLAATKKARLLASEPEPAFVRKLTEFLLRRGFDFDVARQVVREFKPNAAEDDS